MTKIELTDHELALCVAAIDNGIQTIVEGVAAAARMNISIPASLEADADGLRAVRKRLLDIDAR